MGAEERERTKEVKREEGVVVYRPALPTEAAPLPLSPCSAIVHPHVVATYFYDILPTNRGGPTMGTSGLEVSECVQGEYKIYLVQEYCEFTLSRIMDWRLLHQDRRPLLDIILHILGQLAQGMAYIHRNNIIHGARRGEGKGGRGRAEREGGTWGLHARPTDSAISVPGKAGRVGGHAQGFTGIGVMTAHGRWSGMLWGRPDVCELGRGWVWACTAHTKCAVRCVCVCVCVGDLKPENVLLKAGKGKGGSAGAPGEGGGVAGDSALRSVTAKVGDFGLW